MSIQLNIETVRKGKCLQELVGFTEMGIEGDYIKFIKDGEQKQEPRCYILQLLFQGITGFRFSFGTLISKQENTCDLYVLLWEAVFKLEMFDL